MLVQSEYLTIVGMGGLELVPHPTLKDREWRKNMDIINIGKALASSFTPHILYSSKLHLRVSSISVNARCADSGSGNVRSGKQGSFDVMV